MRIVMLPLLTSLCVFGCNAIQEGPPVDLTTVAVPKVVEDATKAAAKPVPPPPPPVPTPRDSFKAWIPPVVTANGDVTEGHYIKVSDKAPQKELVKPDYEIPKTPRFPYQPPPQSPSSSDQRTTPGAVQRPALPSPAVPLPPLPVAPQGGAYVPAHP